jgi:hypothetical protein
MGHAIASIVSIDALEAGLAVCPDERLAVGHWTYVFTARLLLL